MKYQEAVEVINAEIRKDKELYYAFQANIAMQFVDENRRQGSRDSYKKVHGVANEAAKNFLNLFIAKRPRNKGCRQSLRTTTPASGKENKKSPGNDLQQSKTGPKDSIQIFALP